MTTVTVPGTRVIEAVDTAYEPLYHLILLNDDDHTYDYVIVMLGMLFGYSVEKAFAIARIVDGEGQAVVMTGSHDEASRKQQQIHSFGADPFLERCAGSMSAVVEPAR